MTRAAPDARSSGRRDLRLAAIVATVLAVAGGGALLSTWNPTPTGRPAQPVQLERPIDARIDPGGHARSRRSVEVDARFRQGVVMLHARQYEHAAVALHRVLELAPELPEAHVNLGFAMLGLKRYAAARDFFNGATVLRPRQTNAYWGLAVALEGLGDLEAALGAMRTFVHLSVPGAPFLRKAQAAIWEWETRLKEKG